MKIVKRLKGGSLSKTVLVNTSKGLAVRKLISIENNREFGFYRWFSQYKKLQRFSVLFPDIFPKIFSSGVNKGYYFFDIEYFQDAVNCYDFLCSEKNEVVIKKMFNKILSQLKKINDKKYPSIFGGDLVFCNEEIKKRINLFKKQKIGKNFLSYKKFFFNKKIIDNSIDDILFYIDKYNFQYLNKFECYTHGNITLENILYIPKKNKIIFVDPYEENFVDCEHQEFSQLLQSSNSHYEILCEKKLNIKKNVLKVNYSTPLGIEIFNKILKEYIKSTFSKKEKNTIKFFEMAQFIRMLPFKLEIDPERAKLFLIIALKIFNEEIND